MTDEFEWDDAKASANLKKHGVSFEEAASTLDDPRRVELYDDEHSRREDRYLLLGLSNRDRLLVVVFTERSGTIRIISARGATKSDRQFYERLNHGQEDLP